MPWTTSDAISTSGDARSSGHAIDLAGDETRRLVGKEDIDRRELDRLACRPNALFSPNFSTFSCGCPPDGWSTVQTGPGATTLALIPFSISCFASALVSARMPALVVAQSSRIREGS
jgi:hypothetical protein